MTKLSLFKQRSLRLILIICISAGFGMPLLNQFYIAPRYTERLIESVEEDSIKICRHIGREVITEQNWHDWLSQGMIPDYLHEKLSDLTEDFDLLKIKFFLADGTTIYSSDIADVGEVNRKDYFHTTVAGGDAYSKLVEKHEKSLEGADYAIDVTETYVPVMRDGTFVGAFELYRNVSDEVEALQAIALEATLLPGGLAILLLAVVVKVLSDLKHSIQLQKQAEADITEALDAAWQLTESVEEKNSELQRVNAEFARTNAELQAAQQQLLEREQPETVASLAADALLLADASVATVRDRLQAFKESPAAVAGTAEAGRRQLEEAYRESSRLATALRNLNAYAKMVRQPRKLVDPNDCIRQAVATVADQLETPADIRCELKEVPPLDCIPQQLSLALANLLFQVVEISPAAGRIDIRSWCEADRVRIALVAHDCGGRFFEAGSGEERACGLGLSVARDFAARFAGEVETQSLADGGAGVTLSLPLRPSGQAGAGSAGPRDGEGGWPVDAAGAVRTAESVLH